MKPKKWIFVFILLGCSIFALSPGPIHLIQNPSWLELREQLVYLTGICSMSLMVLSMILSVRLKRINRLLGGLDKAYVVHRSAGIFASVFVVLHWLTEEVPHWLVELNIIRHPGELGDESRFSELQVALFQAGTAIAEIVFYVFIIFILIALFRRIPYRFFRVTHKLFPGIFLLLAFHAATAQLKEDWMSSPAGYLLCGLLAVGSISALVGLFQQIGKSRRIKTEIKEIQYHKTGIFDIHLESVDKPWTHRAGQYAFLRFGDDKEPHPFTIASSSEKNPNGLRFVIKGLGDFTKELNDRIRVGLPVDVEGPYGEFTFEDDCERQVWIAGGIGITPFLAYLDFLSERGGTKKKIDFWYCTRGDLENQFPSSLQNLCKENGIDFYHLNSNRKEYLTVAKLHAAIGDFKNVSIWFCGPEKFAIDLRKDLAFHKFDFARFHYDSFSMR
ncbi:hypothetical protein EHQ76_10750 [Leptospira barantonii]|uniref:FAD-binding FR-type domain-containing protein n=1 Tax=Leptospira barantonii TaxID=2023184 RepID=A0A5F2B6C2_9LEPT|nr:ferric reductase-like transmembrane domain-containing protein [Leptospira barantonii]TGM01109.1 hypothetical protein EHQ76_10750 [Leptospira barantonii]